MSFLVFKIFWMGLLKKCTGVSLGICPGVSTLIQGHTAIKPTQTSRG